MKRDNKVIGKRIIELEQRLALGRDRKSTEDKIENIMKNLSPSDLLEVVAYIEQHLDNKEKF